MWILEKTVRSATEFCPNSDNLVVSIPLLLADIENSDLSSRKELHEGRTDEGGLEESWFG